MPPSADEADSDNDPAEGVNRAIFKVNVAADHAVVRPVAQAYTDHVPEFVQTGIHNVVQNLKEPAVAVNDVLQGNVNHAWQSAQRLAVNTTVGAAGMFDVAEKWGVPPHKADFGQTLAVWGVGEGPFVELPLLGPSNPRDAVGTVVDLALNPLTFVGGAPATYRRCSPPAVPMSSTREPSTCTISTNWSATRSIIMPPCAASTGSTGMRTSPPPSSRKAARRAGRHFVPECHIRNGTRTRTRRPH